MDPKLLEVRKRLRDNYEYYSRHALKIRTKAGDIQPLKLNKAQTLLNDAVENQMMAEGRVRVIILKARQQGLSTYVGGRIYFRVSQRKAAKGLVVAHKADSTTSLFDMTKRYHEHVPEILKPKTKYSSRRELVFDMLDSSYSVATAGGDGIARGETITHLHASELAFWPNSSARTNWNGLIQSVPNLPGTEVYIESTANGVTGLFYELWQGAVKGENGYVPVFIPWFLDDGYRDPVPKKFELTPDEKKLQEEFSLDLEQLAWRRRKIAENGIDLFRQEYPATPDEAFLTTGRPVFNPDQLQELLKNHATAPKSRMALEGEQWTEHPRGELQVFRDRDPAETYYIGADVGMGVRDGDWSVAIVLDSQKRMVSKFRAQIHPDYFATILNHLGNYYNLARLIVESNNHGILTCHQLSKEHNYQNFYSEIQHDKEIDRETVKLGFHTNVRTKPMIIDELRASMRDGELDIQDSEVLREMMTYIVNESGKMEADSGCHDDCVMALALVNYVHEGAWTPIVPQDDWYLEMI